MIRVLIVDDEKLVRQGLITSLPWAEYGMQVVGEAKNGEKAIEYLEQHEVDLMLTDLAMPVMSGIELMRIVRKRYPQLYIIILTLHQDFEYIQEALRLGAIDYIAKVELTAERFSEILARIHERIMEEEKKTTQSGAPVTGTTIEADQGYALLSFHAGQDAAWINALYPEQSGSSLEEALWIGYPADKHEHERLLPVLTQAVQDRPEWMLVGLDGLRGREKQDVLRALRLYKEEHLFYDWDTVIRRSFRELQEKLPDVHERDVAEIGEQWSAPDWIHHDERFALLLDKLKAMKLDPSKLMPLLRKLTKDWNALYGSVLPEPLELPEEFNTWQEVADWFRQIRKTLSKTLGAPHYSQEVQDAVKKAVQLIQEQLSGQLYAADIAKRVNMSRSYFSQCFRDIIGKTFNEYVRQVRIDKAKEYLVHTNMPILWVAEKTGYLDGKYFSNVFREQTGELPSAFRKIHRKE